MKKTNEKLSQVLNIDPIEISHAETEQTTEIIEVNNSSVENDAEFARLNIKELITKGNKAVDGILHVAKESEHPRAYEVAAAMLKNLADMNKDLMEIQKRKKDLSPKEFDKPNINVNQAVFVGTTAELVEFLKQKKLESKGQNDAE